MSDSEVRVEHLLGRRVRDEGGRVLGRIEEMCVEVVDGELVVLEFHLGAAALMERIAGFTAQLPFLGWLGKRKGVCVDWDALDLSDVQRPVARAFRTVDVRERRS
jgi:sporulation protein YlmC with PRC-barrel domain